MQLRERLARTGLWKHFSSLDARRRWWLERVPDGPLKDYYRVPFPSPGADIRSIGFLALDFETTGLDFAGDEILSIGFAVMRGRTLCMDHNDHYLVRPSGAIPEASAVVHGILDDHIGDALDLEDALARLLRALSGRVMVAHHAPIEYRFLTNACDRVYGFPFLGPVVDTLELETRSFRHQNQPMKAGALRLANARERYGLPRYRAHNALIDAISAAELLLAQIEHRTGKTTPRLKELTTST